MVDQRLQIGLREENAASLAKCIFEEKLIKEDYIQMEKLETVIAKLDDLKANDQDSLLEVNLGNEGEYKLIYVS